MAALRIKDLRKRLVPIGWLETRFYVFTIFSERELMFMFAFYVVVRPSVCRLSSVTFVHPTQPIVIFRNVSAPFNTLVT